MDVHQIRKVGRAWPRFPDEFCDVLGRCDTRSYRSVYGDGQRSELQRKSLEPMALRAGVSPAVAAGLSGAAGVGRESAGGSAATACGPRSCPPAGHRGGRRDGLWQGRASHGMRSASVVRVAGPGRELRGPRAHRLCGGPFPRRVGQGSVRSEGWGGGPGSTPRRGHARGGAAPFQTRNRLGTDSASLGQRPSSGGLDVR